MARMSRMEPRGVATLVLALAALLVAGPVWAECTFTKIAELPIKTAGNRIEVEARIDDQPATLLVDTGAAFSELSPAAARRLGLAIRDVDDRDLLSILGRTHAQTTTIQSLTLGALVGGERRVLVGDDDLPSGAAAVGVVGEDVLEHADVELDLPHGVMRLFKSSGCADAQMPYWAKLHYSRIPLKPDADLLGGVYALVRLNDRPLTATFDTGAPASMVVLSAASASGVRRDDIAANAGSADAWVGFFDNVSLGDETVHNARIRLADERLYDSTTALAMREGPDSGRSAMILGLDFFRTHRALISPSHHMIYFTYDGGPVFRPDSAGAPH